MAYIKSRASSSRWEEEQALTPGLARDKMRLGPTPRGHLT